MIIHLDVPPEIEAGLITGDLIRRGGVVRDRLGIIVKHLKEVPGPAGNQEIVGRAVVSLHRPWVIIAATALSAATVSASVVLAARKREQDGKRIKRSAAFWIDPPAIVLQSRSATVRRRWTVEISSIRKVLLIPVIFEEMWDVIGAEAGRSDRFLRVPREGSSGVGMDY